MSIFHIAIATQDLDTCISDYSDRLGAEPTVVIQGQYALWRTAQINLSVRYDPTHSPGSLRHLGWQDDNATDMSESRDCHGTIWEHFSAAAQDAEIAAIWPPASPAES